LPQERILLIQLRQLGDILLTTPCLRAVRAARPNAHLSFLSHAMGRLVLDECPFLDEHFTFESSWTWRQHWRLARTLRDRQFGSVVDFMNNPRSAFFARMSGAPVRLAFRSARWPAYSATIPKAAAAGYIVREKFRLLAAAGIPADDVRPILPWFEGHALPFIHFFASTPDFRAARVKVALSPTHRREVRRWPLANYAALARRLVQQWQAAVVWIYGPGEEAVIDEVMAMCDVPTLKAPPTSLRELAAFLGNMDLFIGNSNGPSHIAVAVDIPSLQLHGPTLAVSWCPMTARHQAVQAPLLGLTSVPTMAAVSVDMVWDKLQGMQPVILDYVAQSRATRPRLNWQ